MNRKKLMMILATTTIMVMLLVPMLATQLAVAATYDPEYMTVDGVLATDGYVLWPFNDAKSLKVGFSKYGTMIDRNTKTGIEYGGATDPFAGDPAAVAEYEWVEGWILDITYEAGGQYKNVWAFALHSDYYNISSIGGPWNEGVTVDPTDISVLGGRKTSGGAYTDPIKVLYDGPRRFVALCHTIVYEDVAHNYPLVDLKITVVFNKVKKQVILYKDFKRLDTRKSVGDMQIEFSERGEWDLGAGAPPKSYANIYQYQSTVYDYHYQGWYNNAPSGFDGTYDLLQIIDDDSDYIAWAAWWPKPITSWVEAIHLINRDIILKTMTTYEETWTVTGQPRSVFVIDDHDPVPEPHDNVDGDWSENPMVFVDNFYQIEGTDYEYDTVTDTITFYPASEVQVGSTVKAVYKINASKTNMSEEPGVPFANAEWACVMDETTDMFRAVTVYGVSDYNDGVDGGAIDSEIQFYMDETFNPYDLNDAVHKETRRHIYKKTLTSTTSTVVLPEKPFLLADWNTYCTFAERILVNGVLKRPAREPGFPDNYAISVSSTTGVATVTFTPALPAGTQLKILYSTKPQWSDSASLLLGTHSENVSAIQGDSVMMFDPMSGSASLPRNPLGVDHTFAYDLYGVVVGLETNSTFNYTNNEIDLDLQNDEFKVTYDPNTTPDYVSFVQTDDTVVEDEYANVNYTLWIAQSASDGFWLTMDCNSENTYVNYINVNFELLFDTWYNTTTDELNVTVEVWAHVVYSEQQEGTYEWMVVGKDAKSVDNAGAAYMTQAFDSKKQIHVTTTGLDICEADYGPEVPFVMGGAATSTRTDYYFDYPTDMRPSLADDWCTTVPVASSNMLFAGGPRANLGSEYFNEFTMAFYAMGENVVNDTGHANEILALSCWDKHSYGAGYATISVYKDLNGTIGFLIWGVEGQDTYYACQWFWNNYWGMDGIYYLQQENEGVTDIILKINYTKHPAQISIVERLGTISHKEQHDCPPTELFP